jgi:hypothetical protein
VKAIIPLNIAALRVSRTDQTNVTPGRGFAGRTAAFDQLPHGTGTNASTGDAVWLPLGSGTPTAPLQAGVHLHWELPEYFKRGRQDPDTGAITFPAAPTRWLVVRSLSTYTAGSRYGPPQHASWVVESDYLTPALRPDSDGIVRPATAVPITAPGTSTPYMFIGRVVPAASWNPASEQPGDYLPHYTGSDGKPLYLTSIGFAGAAFSSYYPDCSSVFGFWDTFADLTEVRAAVTGSTPIRFRVSYQVIGWLPDAASDPLSTLAATVTSQYGQYVAQCAEQQVRVTSTPADIFARVTSDQFGWQFSGNAVSYTLGPDSSLTSLEVPDTTLCAGLFQELVWDQLDPSTATPFLAAPGGPGPWTDEVQIAVGDTTVQAVSAMVKSHLAVPGGSSTVLSSYETLLDALQLGLLRDLEGQGNSLATLEQALHAGSFSSVDGGRQWTIQTKAAPGSQASVELTLPLTLAEQLSALDNAQLAYEQARRRLTAARQQLFMDWVIWVKQYVSRSTGNTVDTGALGNFLATTSSGELRAVTAAGTSTGLLHYQTDADSGRVTGVSTASASGTLAAAVVSAYQAAAAALPDAWELDVAPADPFWMPTDPVLVLEGDRLEPVRRNGPASVIAVRADSELISELDLTAAAGHWTVAASALAGLPAPPAALPAVAAAAAVLGEAALLDPQYAAAVAAASGAPDAAPLAAALTAAVGGQSPLDPPAAAGLYGTLHADGYQRAKNPPQTVPTPEQLTVTFTNAAKTALPPDAVGWNTQAALPEFSAARADPFLPVWMTWRVRLDPLARGAGGNYDPTTLGDKFSLDADQTDLTYPVPASFTTGQPVDYSGAVVLSKKPFVSLTEQIDRYIAEFAADAANSDLAQARADLAGRKVMSQALDTFNLAQTLRTTIPQIAVQDLVRVPDTITGLIRTAVTATAGDNWYDTGFNSLTAISTGQPALYNYGPLRSGFAELRNLTIIDVFGQVMNLTTAGMAAGGPLQIVPAVGLSPAAGDSANAGKAYLPPRVLAPARVDAHWLSASHDQNVAGVTADFVEVNDHPATSPVCGWIMSNHLDVSLAFYDAGGSAVGSFGLEHGASKYRTRAGNTANPGDSLEQDIASVNSHLAQLMRFIGQQPAGFLTDLMAAIEQSDQFINPAGYAQDIALPALVGRPLAIARMVQSISTAGGVLPASQANTSSGSALSQAVAGSWFDYGQRQASISAGLSQVLIPAQLGDLTNIDDGLVAYLPESSGEQPYSVVYSSAAPGGRANGVRPPGPDTVRLTLNGAPQAFTVIVDPRAPVHISTGILPTAALPIPPDQYLRAAQALAVTFTARPVLRGQPSLSVPLPDLAGFGWSWVTPGTAPTPLSIPSSPDAPAYGYSPQRLLEGWLDLIPDTASSSESQNGG